MPPLQMFVGDPADGVEILSKIFHDDIPDSVADIDWESVINEAADMLEETERLVVDEDTRPDNWTPCDNFEFLVLTTSHERGTVPVTFQGGDE